jgi:predicted HicB family RNase H-like nuclease
MSNTIEYKNYIGSVNYSNTDKCFFGKIEMIDDLITFEAENVADLENNFKLAVNDYIATCKQLNKNPQKAYKGTFNVRIEPNLHKKLYKTALKNNVSLNAFIAQTLKNSLKENYVN